MPRGLSSPVASDVPALTGDFANAGAAASIDPMTATRTAANNSLIFNALLRE